MRDFTVIDHGTVWTVRADSEEAKAFAREYLPVESWQGTPEQFTTDWRPARDLAERLEHLGFEVEQGRIMQV